MNKLKYLSVCSGVGGFDYGLDRSGWSPVAMCEAEDYPVAVLRRHWPDVPVHRDMRTLDGRQYRGGIDAVVGGIPCQPFSTSGKQRGTDDPRHLFPHFLRLMRESDAPVGLIENVRGLLSNRGGESFHIMLNAAVANGFRVEWQVLEAATLGACHIRSRVFIVLSRTGYTWPHRIKINPRWRVPRKGPPGTRPQKWPKSGVYSKNGWAETPQRWPKPGVWPWLVSGGEGMVPTPNASIQNYDEDPAQWEARRAAVQWRVGNGNGIGLPLGQWAQRREPGCGLLGAQPVEWMQGWPIGWTLTEGPSLLDAPLPQRERWPDCAWTTTEPEAGRRQRLKACGNGVYGPCGEAVGRDLYNSFTER